MPLCDSTSPALRLRRDPCAASQASSSRGAAPSVLCSANRSISSLVVILVFSFSAAPDYFIKVPDAKRKQPWQVEARRPGARGLDFQTWERNQARVISNKEGSPKAALLYLDLRSAQTAA